MNWESATNFAITSCDRDGEREIDRESEWLSEESAVGVGAVALRKLRIYLHNHKRKDIQEAAGNNINWKPAKPTTTRANENDNESTTINSIMLIQAKQNGESKENSNLPPPSRFFLEFLLLQSLLQEALAGRQQLPFATTANRNNNYEGKQQQSIAKRQSKLATANKNKIKPQLTNYYLLKISHKKKRSRKCDQRAQSLLWVCCALCVELRV